MDGGRRFVEEDLAGARFERCDLTGAVVRGSAVGGLEVDDPWLGRAGEVLLDNGVDVVPFVEAELDRRFPGRSLRRETTAEGLRRAWDAVGAAWGAALDRAAALPPGSVDVRVEGEWSFAETLRHLVMATDAWLRVSVLGVAFDEAFHPWGLPHAEFDLHRASGVGRADHLRTAACDVSDLRLQHRTGHLRLCHRVQSGRAAAGCVHDHRVDSGGLEGFDVGTGEVACGLGIAGVRVQRTTAALLWWRYHLAAEAREHPCGGAVRLWVEVAVHAAGEQRHAHPWCGRAR